MPHINLTYDARSLEKLQAAFSGDPREGTAELYVKEHFDLQRVCPVCERRTARPSLALASAVVEGNDWVLPLSVTSWGKIVMDLSESIPDQSNLLQRANAQELASLGIAIDPHGRIEQAIPIMESRDSYYGLLRQNKRWDYKNVRKRFATFVHANPSREQVLEWDTEVEYDYDHHSVPTPGAWYQSCGFNVESEYFQWLAENRSLLVARVCDDQDVTLALAYAVPCEYEMVVVRLKRRPDTRYRKFGLGTASFFLLLDYIYEKGLQTPLNLRAILERHQAVLHPIPLRKPELQFVSDDAFKGFVDRFEQAGGIRNSRVTSPQRPARYEKGAL